MNKQALFNRMQEQGLRITDMYKALGISRSSFYRKCNGQSEFTLNQITRIMDILAVRDPNEIFFSGKVSKRKQEETP